ncbi:hypothetical protein L4C31_11475 [Aliivibrio sifiae]
MDWYELLAASLGLIFGTYALVWSVPAIFILPLISLGSFKHIIFIDKQLAKDLNKYYDDKGYMRPKYQLSWEVGSRFIDYCITYPFIRKRVTTESKKFKAFMWFNALGIWSYVVLALSLTLLKLTGYMP